MGSFRITPDPDFNRLRTVLMGGRADRVPVLEHAVDQPVKEAFLGRPIKTVADDIAFWHAAGYDCYVVSLRPMAGLEVTHRKEMETTHAKTSSYSVYGEEDTTRNWVEEDTGAIDSWESFERYPWLTPEDISLAKLEEAAKLLPQSMGLIPLYGCILNGAQWLMGFNNFCIKCCEEPDLVAAVIERVGALNLAVLQAASKIDRVGALWYADDLAHDGGLFAAPEFLRKHIFPWMEQIGDLCKQKDLPLIYHSDGNLMEVIEDVIACGVNCLQPVEPKAMDIAEVKRRYGDRIALAGNIDLGYTLTLGPPEGVWEEVKERIRTVGQNGGYCVGSSNSVTDYVPLENFQAMIEATFAYGDHRETVS